MKKVSLLFFSSSQYEIEKIENALIESRNMYILQVNQMNYALKFYIEQFIVDLDKVEIFYKDFSSV